MAKSKVAEAWAQLVSVTDVETPPIPITKDKTIIGRNADSDVSHAGNKLVSGKHCFIERDKQGKVWLYDTSTNGTLLNLKIKLTKGECREISHGDEFYLVRKKDNPENDIGYMFQDMKSLEAETSSDFDDTQEYEYVDPNGTLTDEDVNIVPAASPPRKRKSSGDETSPPNKKPKQDEAEDRDTASTAETSKASRDYSKSNGSEKNKAASTSKVKEPEEDVLGETLVCIICQDILHDCISLQPCMHSFCSGCYSEWMELSQECPSCRLKVERINKNHIVNNLVDAYLKLNPDKRRPEEDIQALEAKNKITRDMLYPARQVTASLHCSDSEEYNSTDHGDDEQNDDDSGDDDDNSDSDGDHYPIVGLPIYPPPVRAPRPVCRQCRDYNPDLDPLPRPTSPPQPPSPSSSASSSPEARPGPSNAQAGLAVDPDKKTYPDPPPYTCPPNGNHVMCMCCQQIMPDRRGWFNYNRNCLVPPQQCKLCDRAFCHAYWGCNRINCTGCLAKFKDMKFGKDCIPFLVLDNVYESAVLKNYMESKGLSLQKVFEICVGKFIARQYVITDQQRIEYEDGVNTPVCYNCALRNFKELVYFYRLDIPNDQLPAEVTSRPNCHWGKNCRTQRHKPDHAKRYNHICEPTRIW